MSDTAQTSEIIERYLELLKRTLTRYQLEDYVENLVLVPLPSSGIKTLKDRLARLCDRAFSQFTLSLRVGMKYSTSSDLRLSGGDWPLNAETMIGMRRLNQLHSALDSIRMENIPGNVLEAGVWRGGASIFMAAYLQTYALHRTVYVLDSFCGLPKPDLAKYPFDIDLSEERFLKVSLEQVKQNFKKYGCLNERIIFVEGFFKATLPTLNPGPLALLRLDADMYESTIQVLDCLYDHVVAGGYVIIDDYNAIPECKLAVSDFVASRKLQIGLQEIDSSGVFWRVNR